MNSFSFPDWVQWVFSGIGVAVIGYLGVLWRRIKKWPPRPIGQQISDTAGSVTAINVGRDLSGTVTVNTLPKPRDPFVINFLADISSFKLASEKLFRETGEGDDAVISIARYGDLQGGICGKYLAAKYSLEADLLQQTEAAWSAFIEASDERTRHSDRDWVAKNLPAAMEIRRRYENAFDEFLRVVSDAFETQARREAR